jgi:hypothetical protein
MMVQFTFEQKEKGEQINIRIFENVFYIRTSDSCIGNSDTDW